MDFWNLWPKPNPNHYKNKFHKSNPPTPKNKPNSVVWLRLGWFWRIGCTLLTKMRERESTINDTCCNYMTSFQEEQSCRCHKKEPWSTTYLLVPLFRKNEILDFFYGMGWASYVFKLLFLFLFLNVLFVDICCLDYFSYIWTDFYYCYLRFF